MWKRLDDLSLSEKHAAVQLAMVGVWAYILPHTNREGVFYADPKIIRAKCMTKRDRVHLGQIRETLRVLDRVRLIHLYSLDDTSYFVLHKVWKWNPVGNMKYPSTAFPSPPLALCPCIEEGRLREAEGEKGRKAGPESGPPLTVPVFSASDSSDSEKDRDAPLPEYAKSPVAGLVPLFGFCTAPGTGAKTAALEDLRRQGVEVGRIVAVATCPDYRSWGFYEIMKLLSPKNGTPKKKTDSALCKHGKLVMYGGSCAQCEKDRLPGPTRKQ